VGTGSHEENASNKTLEPGSDAIRTDKALVANFKGASNPNSRGAACAGRVKLALRLSQRGDAKAKAELRAVSGTMTPAEISQGAGNG
jgi:hypothetical protein